MVNLNARFLLMIEPTVAVPVPVIDSLTRRMAAAIRRAGAPMLSRGCFFSAAVCEGRNSPQCNSEYVLPLPGGGTITTNGLAVFYLAHCRDQVPDRELQKVALLLPSGEVEPTADELWPSR